MRDGDEANDDTSAAGEVKRRCVGNTVDAQVIESQIRKEQNDIKEEDHLPPESQGQTANNKPKYEDDESPPVDVVRSHSTQRDGELIRHGGAVSVELTV